VPHAGAGERRVGAPYCGARFPFPGSLAARPVLNGRPQPPHHGGRRVVEPHATGRPPQHAARSSAAPRRARAMAVRPVSAGWRRPARRLGGGPPALHRRRSRPLSGRRHTPESAARQSSTALRRYPVGGASLEGTAAAGGPCLRPQR